MATNDCANCRRAGTKLFLKGDKCNSPKCTLLRRPSNPGMRKKRRGGSQSEYGQELREKQNLKNWYNLREKQFANYVRAILAKRGTGENTADLLIKKLESRFDNVVFRMGLASSREQARQLVSHGHFHVNGKKVNVPSYEVKKGDVVSVVLSSKAKGAFAEIQTRLKNYQAPAWIMIDPVKLEGKIEGYATLEETAPPAEISKIFERYSR